MPGTGQRRSARRARGEGDGPRRTCVGCRRVADPRAGGLVRVVAAGDGYAVGRALPGRGAWLCAGSPACVDRAVRRNALRRALRAPAVAADGTAVERLRTMLVASARMEDRAL